jgi:hypothetical protein
MGREWVSLRVRPETLAYAQQLAVENDETVSAVLRRLLALGVAAHQEQGTAAAVLVSSPAPEPEAVAGTVSSRACGSFKPRPGNALRCFNCGERYHDHR